MERLRGPVLRCRRREARARDGALLGLLTNGSYVAEVYDPSARSAMLDVGIVVRVLRQVFGADALVEELLGK